jgi:hypothetical protein
MRHERIRADTGAFNWNAVFSAANAPAKRALVVRFSVKSNRADRLNDIFQFAAF